jgi:GDP-mannose transporter
MDRALPSFRSGVSLAVVSLGAVMYCLSDSEFAMNGLGAYSWALFYFVLIAFEMTYGKSLISSVKMDTVWGPVLYCNILSVVPMFLLGALAGDYTGIGDKLAGLTANGVTVLLFSCVVGTFIGYTSWLCRGMVSATTFSLVGVINKFITVLLNVFIWDKHSSPSGLLAVCICLLAGSFYQQSPKRSDLRKAELERASKSEKQTDDEPLIGSKNAK